MAMEPLREIVKRLPTSGEPNRPPENFPKALACDAFVRVWARRGFPELHTSTFWKCTWGEDQERPGEWALIEVRLRRELGTGFIHALIGPRGTGKTQIAVNVGTYTALAGEEISRPRYAKASNIFREIRSAFGKDAQASEMNVVNGYVRPSLLIIDEAHVRGETAFEDRTLTDIIDARYDAQRDTLLIANLTREALAASLGASIVSRIKECGDVIECNWPSFREKKP